MHIYDVDTHFQGGWALVSEQLPYAAGAARSILLDRELGQVPTTHHPPLTTHHPPPTTHHPLTTYSLLRTTCYLCLLPTTYPLLPLPATY